MLLHFVKVLNLVKPFIKFPFIKLCHGLMNYLIIKIIIKFFIKHKVLVKYFVTERFIFALDEKRPESNAYKGSM